jgi:hypothetical protein
MGKDVTLSVVFSGKNFERKYFKVYLLTALYVAWFWKKELTECLLKWQLAAFYKTGDM